MASQRNVAALEVLLAQAAEGQLSLVPPQFREMIEESVRQTIAHVAQYLSEQGVLVPSVLTDDEAVKIGADAAGTVPTERSEIALCVREGWSASPRVRAEECAGRCTWRPPTWRGQNGTRADHWVAAHGES